MLTITTNKEKVQGIADRTLKEYPLPITDFWTKRIVKLLDAGDERTILDSLTDERGTASSLEREVTFTAGGAASVSVMVTIRIAVLEQERTSGGTATKKHSDTERGRTKFETVQPELQRTADRQGDRAGRRTPGIVVKL